MDDSSPTCQGGGLLSIILYISTSGICVVHLNVQSYFYYGLDLHQICLICLKSRHTDDMYVLSFNSSNCYVRHSSELEKIIDIIWIDVDLSIAGL